MARKPHRSLFPTVFLCLLLLLFPVVFLAFSAQAQGVAYDNDLHPVIGISIGNTNSRVAYTKNGTTHVVPSANGSKTTPTIIAFTQNATLIGQAAKDLSLTDPQRAIFGFVGALGKTYDEIKGGIETLPFKVIDRDGFPKFQIPGIGEGGVSEFSPEDLTALMLGEMKGIAEAYLGEEVKNAVVTVPAYFGDAQRAAMRKAGETAGLTILRLMNEPTPAAFAHGFSNTFHYGEPEQRVLVCDIGGTSTDVSVLEVEEGVFEILGETSDRAIGGDAFNERIVEFLFARWNDEQAIDALAEVDIAVLHEQVERAKQRLSTDSTANISVGPWSYTLTRERFASLIEPTLKQPLTLLIDAALKQANLTKYDINDILLTGGSAYLPLIRTLLTEHMDKPPLQNTKISPEEAVIIGAAQLANILANYHESLCTLTVGEATPFSIGVETANGMMTDVIQRGVSPPYRRTREFTTVYDGQTEVTLKVYEGLEEMAKDNTLLGVLRLQDLPPAPAGTTRIDVTLAFDTDNGLYVRVSHEETRKQSTLSIPNIYDPPTQDAEHTLLGTGSGAKTQVRLIVPLIEQPEL